jgi:hypothetical protein
MVLLGEDGQPIDHPQRPLPNKARGPLRPRYYIRWKTLSTELSRGSLLGNRERVFMRGCIKVLAPKVLEWGERALSPGPSG